MKYYIYIDKSGSLNHYEQSFFSISAIIIAEYNLNNFRNWVKRRLKKIKNEYQINSEMKPRYFRSAKKLPALYSFADELRELINYGCSYIDKNFKVKDKRKIINYLIKKIIKSFIKDNIFTKDDELIITFNQDSELIYYFSNIKKHLEIFFLTSKQIKMVNFEYKTFKKSYFIMAVNWLSFVDYRLVKNPLSHRTKFYRIT